jgi:hypothetical protein
MDRATRKLPEHINYDGIIEFTASFVSALLLFAGIYVPRFLPQFSVVLALIFLSLLIIAFAYTYSQLMQFTKKYLNVILISLTGISGLLVQELYAQAGSIRYLAFIEVAAIFCAFLIELYKRNTYEFIASFFTNITGTALVLGVAFYLSASKLMESSDLILFGLVLLACIKALRIVDLDTALRSAFTLALTSLIAIVLFVTLNRIPIRYALTITLSLAAVQILLDYIFEGVNLTSPRARVAFALLPALLQGVMLFLIASLFMIY